MKGQILGYHGTKINITQISSYDVHIEVKRCKRQKKKKGIQN